MNSGIRSGRIRRAFTRSLLGSVPAVVVVLLIHYLVKPVDPVEAVLGLVIFAVLFGIALKTPAQALGLRRKLDQDDE